MEECTFNPNITNSQKKRRAGLRIYQQPKVNNDPFYRLYSKDPYKYKDDLKLQGDYEKSVDELAKCTFSPKINYYQHEM